MSRVLRKVERVSLYTFVIQIRVFFRALIQRLKDLHSKIFKFVTVIRILFSTLSKKITIYRFQTLLNHKALKNLKLFKAPKK